MQRDGYFIMSIACVVLGASLLVGFILPTVKRLQCESNPHTSFQPKAYADAVESFANVCLAGEDPALMHMMLNTPCTNYKTIFSSSDPFVMSVLTSSAISLTLLSRSASWIYRFKTDISSS